ncbi:MAG: MFS transporter [Acidimicrobiales bacterium]
MVAIGTTPAGRPSPLARLWNRHLDHYPDNRPRVVYLGIVVLATIILYYELYVSGAVGPSIIQHYGMSFKYFVYISVASNAVGAFASLIAGAADRYGRANLVTFGLLITGVLTAFGVPNAPNKQVFLLLVVLVGFVEGIVLVATPALVRDFSPQLGRASAMGFWTLGPVVGSLVVSVVSSNTLPANIAAHPDAWKTQYLISGLVGLVVFVVALFGLRELTPNLRDQLMVSARDRALIEARANGLDIGESLHHPWRQMLHLDVVGSAFAISVFLLVYYAATGFFVIYFATIFGFSEKQANGIGNWFWAFDAGVLVVTGLLSDKLRVRKPFMIAGGLGAIVMTYIFLTRATHPHTTYYTFVVIVSLLASSLAVAYAPWMASFTETVERRNPALTATGLAVWGWIIRAVVAVSVFVLPFVVSSMNPLVTYGAQVQTLATKYAPQLKTVSYIDPTTLATLSSNPTNGAAIGKAVAEISAGAHVSPGAAVQQLIAVGKVPKADFAFLRAHGPAVQAAAKSTPHQWTHWWWVCIGGEIVFLPFVLVMAGRWRPRAAKRDAEAHEQLVAEELASLGLATST